ncbi:MAG: hypothetical protein ABSA16_13575 [Thermoguttaceae bacterium]|jgi:predicted RNA-binding Zn-ribbon protein involved in translation (DUF1610 family)
MFKRSFKKWHASQGYNLKDLKKASDNLIAIGVAKCVLAVMFIVIPFVVILIIPALAPIAKVIWATGVIGFLGLGLVGLIGLLRGISRKMKARAGASIVKCSRCGKEQEVIDSILDYPCVDCTSLVFRSLGDRAAPVELACPYCGNKFGATPGRQRVKCPDCAMDLAVNRGTCTLIEGAMRECVNCHHRIPVLAHFCEHCRCVTPEHLALTKTITYRSRVGRSAFGHYICAHAILSDLEIRWGASGKKHPDIKAITHTLPALSVILEELEEAGDEMGLHGLIREALCRLDQPYRTMVTGLLDRIQRNGLDYAYAIEDIGCLAPQVEGVFDLLDSTSTEDSEFWRFRHAARLREKIKCKTESERTGKTSYFVPWESPLVKVQKVEERSQLSPVIIIKFAVKDFSGLTKQVQNFEDAAKSEENR